MKKRLSILTTTLKARASVFASLVRVLKAQANEQVEMLANLDEGGKSIGMKRNELLAAATGDYVVFVDDDDMVSPLYVPSILKALEKDPDCCGLVGIITTRAFGPQKFIHSVKYEDWYEKDGVYYRCPNHLNPIKRQIALDAGFPDISYQEDKDFSMRLKGKLQTEAYIEQPLYYYYPSTT